MFIMKSMIKRLIIIGLIFIVIGTGVTMFFTRDTNPTKESQLLSARLTTLLSLLDNGSKNSTNGDMRSFVNEASVLLLSDQVEFEAGLKSAGTKTADKATLAAEADSSTFDRLHTAQINGQFDSVFPNILEQKLDSTAALVREVQGKTPNSDLKAATTKLYKTLSTLQDRASKF